MEPMIAPTRDMTLDQMPWPQNASASPTITRTMPMITAASPETNGRPGTATANDSTRPIKRQRGGVLPRRRLSAAEDLVRALGDFADPAFVDGLGTDDVLPHVLVRDAGKGRLDVGRLLERHDEPVRELAAHFVRDAGRPLVHEGQDQIELPRLAGEAAERVRVRRDLRAQELVGLLEEQDEPREFLVPLGVQLEEAAGEDVRDEEVHHLVGAVVPEVEDDALPLPDRGEDVVERVLPFFRLLEEGEPVQSADSALQALQGHLVGPLRPEDLHRGLLDRRDQVPPRTALCDLVQGVDHRRREVLQRDDQVLRRDLPRVEDERPRLLVLRIEGEDLDLSREEELQPFRVVRRAEDAVFAVHVEDEDGSDVPRQDAGTHELIEDRLARPGPAEDGEGLLDELLHVQLHIEGLDARDRPEGRGCLRDLVDPLDVLPDGVAAHGEIRRDRLRLAQLLGLPVDELDHPELRLAVKDRPAIPFVGLRSRHDHVADRRAGELVRDVARFVEDVLDQAEEVVPRTFDDDRVRDPEFLRIMQLELRDEAVNHGRGDDLPDLHRRSLATLSRYSWNALRLRPSTCVSPSRIVRASRPIRRAILMTAP